MGTNYDVSAELRVKGAEKSTASVNRLANQLDRIAGNARKGEKSTGSLVKKIAAIGGAYLGIRALGGVFMGAAKSAIYYNNKLQKTSIGLQSVIAATSKGKLNFEQAGKVAGQVFLQIKKDSIENVATAQEMFSMYQNIVGPIQAAGFGLEKVRQITNSATSAAAALGVDIEQATRDMTLMVRGAAGMDTKLFAMLKSTGAITESTQEWNKGLTAQERVMKLQAALSKYDEAAKAYATSWAGLTASLETLRDSFLNALSMPIIEKIRSAMSRVVNAAVAKFDHLRERMGELGETIAARVGPVIDRMADALIWAINNWDTIAMKLQEGVNMVAAMVPKLLAAAKVFATYQGAQMLLGGGMQVAAMGQGIAGPIKKALGSKTGMFAEAATAYNRSRYGTKAAPKGTGTILSRMKKVSMFDAMGGNFKAAANPNATIGILPSIVAGLKPLMVALAPLAAILAAVAGFATLVVDHFDQFVGIFKAITGLMGGEGGVFSELYVQLMRLWEVMKPFLKMIGIVVTLLGGIAFGIIIAGIKGFTMALQWILDTIKPVTDAISAFVDVFATDFLENVRQLINLMGGSISKAPVKLSKPKKHDLGADAMGANTGQVAPNVTHNDFRGSKIEVRQEFKDSEPDRIITTMVQDLQRQAESRIQSGFVPAFSR